MESDLISRSELKKELKRWAKIYEDDITVNAYVGLGIAAGELRKAPGIDAVPVVHGEFERQPEEVIPNMRVTPLLCKTCQTTFITINREGKRCICCSYCGARMDGET